MRKLFWKAAKSTEEVEFQMYMAEIKRVRPEAYNYMMKIPLQVSYLLLGILCRISFFSC